MASAVDQITARLNQLLSEIDEYYALVGPKPDEGGPVSFSAPKDKLQRLMISALQAVRVICSESSPHYAVFKTQFDRFSQDNSVDLDHCKGTLQAALDDLKAGMLGDFGGIIAAEVFGDLLDMSSYLHGEGYHLPSAAIAGAVLEDTLRQLCRKHQVTWTGHSSISNLSVELYKSKVLDKVQFGNVEAWGKLRNKVDHGDFSKPDEVSKNDVGRMIDGVRDLIAASGLGR